MTRRGRYTVSGVVLTAIVLGPLAAGGAFLASVDPAAVKARIVDAVQRATGRRLAVGALRFSLLPELTIDADAVALANPAGFSRPDLLTARHVRARVAWLPMLQHRVVIRDIVLTGPDLMLEQRPDGAVNWRFDRAPRSAGVQDAGPGRPATTGRSDALTVLGIGVSDGVVSWAAAGTQGRVLLGSVEVREINASSTIHLAAQLVLGGDPVTIDGRLGGQTHLWDVHDRSDWPVELTLNSPAGGVAVNGGISDPLHLAGYDVTIAAHGPDLARLAAVVPAITVPRLRDGVLETRLIDRPDGLDMPWLKLRAGASDLGGSIAGLTLTTLEVSAPNIDGTNGTQPNHVQLAGQYANQPLQLDATLGPVGRLLGRGQPGARAPITLDAVASAAGARLAVRGRVAPFGDWAGTDVTAEADIPELALLSPLAGRPLPALRTVEVQIGARSQGGVLSVHDARLSLAGARIAVDGTARLSGRPDYRGHIAIVAMDLDAIRAALPASAARQAAATEIAPEAGPPAPARSVIPDLVIPFDRLRGEDAQIGLSIEHLVSHGVAVDDVAAQLRLDHGRLDVDPVAGKIAGAPLSGSLSADVTGPVPVVALDLRAPGMDLAQLLAAVGDAGDGSGRLDLDAALVGTGGTPHAIAGTLDGHVGLALTDGRVANRFLAGFLAYLAPSTGIGLELARAGSSEVACLATRIDLHGGVAVPRAFLLDTKRLRLTAAGAVDLRDESFSLRLRPYIRLGPTGLVLPSRADGPWRSPHLTLEPASGAASAATLAETVVAGRGGDATLGAVMAGLAGAADALLGESASGDCTPALAMARDPVGTVALAAPATPAPTRRERAIELLRRLFKRPG